MEPTLVFLPGLGANHRLFKFQTATFPNSLAVDWIDPLPTETLEEYAVRLSASIRAELDKRPTAPVIVCGLSLGGMIAPYVARHLEAVGCILLCSIQSPDEFPRRYYADWLLMRTCPPLRRARLFVAQIGARLLICPFGLFPGLLFPKVVRQFAEFPNRRLAGLSRMMFDWAYRQRTQDEIATKNKAMPMLHIHGTRDPLLPIRLTNPDVRIDGGGHLLAITHPDKINELITQFVSELDFQEEKMP